MGGGGNRKETVVKRNVFHLKRTLWHDTILVMQENRVSIQGPNSRTLLKQKVLGVTVTSTNGFYCPPPPAKVV
jgi:hypothetical protein